MNEENDWDHMGCSCGVKLVKAAGPPEANTEMIVTNGKIGVEVMVKLCQRVFNGKFQINGRQEWLSRFIKEKEMS